MLVYLARAKCRTYVALLGLAKRGLIVSICFTRALVLVHVLSSDTQIQNVLPFWVLVLLLNLLLGKLLTVHLVGGIVTASGDSFAFVFHLLAVLAIPF